jgi:hypothetical protein
MNPYAGRMRAMLIFAFFPLLALVAQPAGSISYWLPVLIIGVAGAAHQAWSANIFQQLAICSRKSNRYHHRNWRNGWRNRFFPD